MKRLFGNAGGSVVISIWLFKFFFPQNFWDWLEALRFSKDLRLPSPELDGAIQWILITIALALLIWANLDALKEAWLNFRNPIIPLHEAAQQARIKLRNTQWQEIAEGWTNSKDDVLSWFGTYIAMSTQILAKRPQALDFAPLGREELGRGRITDGATTLTYHGGQVVFTELAVRARNLSAAIKSMKKDSRPLQSSTMA
jgi:hypothetical protein